MENIKFRTAYDGLQKTVSDETSYFDVKPSLTKQSFRDECEINNIMKKWQKTGMMDHLAKVSPQFGDFSNYTSDSYQDALNIVITAQEAFAALSSDIRGRFYNDPTYFLDFVNNPDNADEIVKLGLGTYVKSNSSSESDVSVGEKVST